MRTALLSLLVFALAGAAAAAPKQDADSPAATPSRSLDTMKLTRLDGTPLPDDTLDGKAVLFVNVASRCGYTRQYEGLQALWQAKKDDGLVIVGVPCNQFGAQEPGSSEEIATFCQRNYGVDFPLLEKQKVNGKERSELYTYLVDSSQGGGADIKWNFEKFVVGRDGEVVARFASGTEPDSDELARAIDAALARPAK